jgi:hypothetical protein
MSTRFFLAMAAAVFFAGCARNVGPEATGGGGAGGGIVPGDGGAGGTGHGGTGGGTQSGTTSGGSGGAASCDALGQCGDMSHGCLGCSFIGPCANEAEACYHDQDCGDYQSCLGDCMKGDLMCTEACKAQHPAGADEFDHLYLCAVCQQCASSCADTAMLCPVQ